MRSFFLSASIACVSIVVLVTSRPIIESPTMNMGGVGVGRGTVTTWNADRMDYFVRGTDNDMWHLIFTDNAWTPTGWENLGGTIISSPSCTAWSDHRHDCFAVGSDNQVYHKCFDGSWHGWDSVGGTATSEPSCVSREPLSLDCYIRSTDNTMNRLTWTNGAGWSAWISYGGILTSAPACVAANEQVTCYMIGTDGQMYSRDGLNVASSWRVFEKPIPGEAYTDTPSAFNHADGVIEILVRGKGGQIYRIKRQPNNGPLGEWEKVNYPGNVPVFGISRSLNTIDYFSMNSVSATQHHSIIS